MFEFAVRTTIARFDLKTAEGRVQAARAVAPIVATIRDRSLRPEYTREVAGWLGLEVEQVATEVSRSGRLPADRRPAERPTADEVVEPAPGEGRHLFPMPDTRDPVVNAERQLLQVLMQFPNVLKTGAIDQLEPGSFSAPAHQAVFDAIRVARSGEHTATVRGWAAAVAEAAPGAVSGLVSELAVAQLPTRLDPLTGLPASRYVEELFTRVRTVALTRRIADALSELRRLDHAETPDPGRTRSLAATLQDLQRELAGLKAALG